MKIDREITGDVAVLGLRGEFDSFVVNSFLEEVEALAISGVRSLVLDMRMVKFIMSTAIGAIVKSRKMMKELGGDLVISQPSSFVRDVLESLQLTRVIKVFDENNQAITQLGTTAGSALPVGNSALLHFNDGDKQSALGKPAIGRISDLTEDGLSLSVSLKPHLFPSSADVRVKFRLPLFKRSYYFEIPSKVVDAVPEADGAKVKIRFTRIEDPDRESIRQFLSDMNFLRSEAKNPNG